MTVEVRPRRGARACDLPSPSYLALVAAVILLGSPKSAMSQESTPAVGDSARAIVSPSDTIRGTVASMTAREWVLLFGNEERMTVDPTQVGQLEVRRTHSAWKAGAWIGGLVGAVVGATAWANTLEEEGECTSDFPIGCTEAEMFVRFGMGGAGGILGALLGAAVGSAIQSSVWIPATTASPGEYSDALELSWRLTLTGS